MTLRELKQECVDNLNNAEGYLTDYDCPECKNRGYIYYLDDNDMECCRECKCMKVRRIRARAKKSGLGEALKKYTFDKYKREKPWQIDVYDKARDFVKEKTNCFFIGGAVGAGKSHICTAISGCLIKQGYEVQFVVWNDAVTELKQLAYDYPDEYNSYLERLKTVDVLYIDDFFKTTPTTADIDKAFQIINYRYNMMNVGSKKKLITIISSEKNIDDLERIDKAIASRLYEMASEKYVLAIDEGDDRNMRYNKK